MKPLRTPVTFLATSLILGMTVAACSSGSSGGPSASNAGGTAKGPIKFGVLDALTGSAASFGTREVAAVKAVVEETNAKGGINGRKIQLIVKDTKTDPNTAVRQASSLIGDGVIGIFGSATGSTTLSYINATMKAEIPVIPPVSTAEVTDPSKPYTRWVFRPGPKPGADVDVMLKKAATNGARRIGVLYQEDAYGTSEYKLAKKDASKFNVRVVGSASAASDAVDVTSQMTRILKSNPDAIFTFTSPPPLTGAALRTAQKDGFKGPIYGVEGSVQLATIKAAQGHANTYHAPAMINPSDLSTMPKLTRLMKGHGGVSGFAELLGADGMGFVVEALKQSGATTGTELRDALTKIRGFKAYGNIPWTFGENKHDGFPDSAFFWVHVKDGKFVNDN